MIALVLAAGYATRLYPLTIDKPKPLLLIQGVPIVEHIIRKLEKVPALDKIFIITNQKFLKNFQDWKKNETGSVPLEVINDKTMRNSERLGAIGDIAFAINEKNLDEDLLVIAGDNLFDFELAGFVEFVRKTNGASVGIYDVKELDRAKKFGVVSLNGESRIVNFKEKPKSPSGTLVALAVYYFPKRALPLFDEYLKEADKIDAPGYYIDWLSKKESVFGYEFQGNWYDIGDVPSYNRAKKEWVKRR